MLSNKIVHNLSKGFILLSAISLLSVSLMAFVNPQQVMDLVNVDLPNNDAYSSIRGVYGGVGLSLVIGLVYLLRKHVTEGLGFLAIFWGLYALSRIITLVNEGPLGGFGTQWLCIEIFFFLTAVTLRKVHR